MRSRSAAFPGEPNALVILEVETAAEEQRYLMPLSVRWGEQNLTFGAPKLSHTLAKIRSGANLGALLDAAYDERFVRDLIAAMRAGGEQRAQGSTLRFEATEAFRALDLPARSMRSAPSRPTCPSPSAIPSC